MSLTLTLSINNKHLYHSFWGKKVHDWEVEQLTDLFRTTLHTKTEHVTKSRGRHCGDVHLTSYLVNTEGPVSLVLDLRIDHDRFGSISDPSLITLTIITILRVQSPLYLLLLVRLGGYIVNSLDCYSYRIIGKLTTFLQFQEFSFRNPTWTIPLPSYLVRLQIYVSI